MLTLGKNEANEQYSHTLTLHAWPSTLLTVKISERLLSDVHFFRFRSLFCRFGFRWWRKSHWCARRRLGEIGRTLKDVKSDISESSCPSVRPSRRLSQCRRAAAAAQLDASPTFSALRWARIGLQIDCLCAPATVTWSPTLVRLNSGPVGRPMPRSDVRTIRTPAADLQFLSLSVGVYYRPTLSARPSATLKIENHA